MKSTKEPNKTKLRNLVGVFQFGKIELCHTYNITYLGNGYYLCFLSKEKCDSLLLDPMSSCYE